MAFKKFRKMNVYSSSGYNYKNTPSIILKGDWLKESGFDIGGLIQVECGMDESLDTVCKLMGEVPPWAKGLELRADGYETMFYKKNRKEYNVHLENQQACDKLNKEYMLRGDLIMASNRKKTISVGR